MIEQNSEKADDKIEEFSMDEIEELFLASGKLRNCLALQKYRTIIRIIRRDMTS